VRIIETAKKQPRSIYNQECNSCNSLDNLLQSNKFLIKKIKKQRLE
jgi:hypothetical protein